MKPEIESSEKLASTQSLLLLLLRCVRIGRRRSRAKKSRRESVLELGSAEFCCSKLARVVYTGDLFVGFASSIFKLLLKRVCVLQVLTVRPCENKLKLFS